MKKTLLYFLTILFVNVHASAQTFTPLNTVKDVQLGLGAIDYWYKPFFANALYMESRGWASTSTTYPIQSDQFDADGYPLYLTTGQVLYVNPGQNSGTNKAAYAGKVCLSWEGDADIRITSGTYLSGSASTGSVVNGKRYYTNTTTNGVRAEIRAINAANPPKNIKIWLNDLRDPTKSLDPAEQGGHEYLVNPAYSDVFAIPTFHMFRFMDMTMTNSSPIQNWADRRKPTDCFQTGTKNGIKVGIAYEKAIQICNEFGKDMWINIPPMATEDFVKKLAMLINGQDPDNIGSPGLNSNLRCYVEYGNEMAWSFWIDYCATQGTAEGGLTGMQFAGRQSARSISWFKSIVGATNERFKYVEGIQTSVQSTSDQKLNESCVAYGPTLTPSGKPDMIAITNYFGSEIEKYVFENINYWDTNVQSTELQKVFKEFEKRTLSGTASITGVDFTGGGVNSATIALRDKYSLPLISYEGGCGLNLSGYKCINSNCKLVASTDPTSYFCTYFMRDLADSCGGGANFMNFMRAVHSSIYMKKMFEINYSLVKANGVETVSQFGDILDMGANSNLDYGYWACMNDLTQDITQAHRYQFWKEWYNEYQYIGEVGSPINNAPHFDTQGELEPAVVGNNYNYSIDFSGGDGALSVKLISSASELPQNLTFTTQANKIQISGTPTIGDEGNYYIFYRLLDGDNDPAYRVFTLKIMPAVKDTLFTYEDFGTTTGPLYNTSNGYGFSSNWMVQANSLVSFAIKDSIPFPSYSNLVQSKGAYGVGGGSYRYSGRDINVSGYDYLINSNSSSNIGQAGTSLWVSALMKRLVNTNGKDILSFYNKNGFYYYRSTANPILLINSSGNFAIDYNEDVNIASPTYVRTNSTVPCTVGQTYFVVMEIRFGLFSDIINVYINPTNLGSSTPLASPDITYTSEVGKDINIAKLSFYGNYTTNSFMIDDLRMGDSFKAVTPTIQLTAANQSANSQKLIYTTNKTIVLENLENEKQITIYNALGIRINSLTGNTNKIEIPVAFSGIYYVVTDSFTEKVIVK